MSKLDQFIEVWQDERIAELQRLVDTQPPYQPQPGDPDYLTAEQVARIQAGLAELD